MNRLILIGNGFDLAHGLKTSYNDFLLWYIKTSCVAAQQNGSFEGPLFNVGTRYRWSLEFQFGRPFEKIIDYFFSNNLYDLLVGEGFKINNSQDTYTNPIIFKFKSTFFETLIIRCSNCNWVDIENEYYQALKGILQESENRKQRLEELNDSFHELITQLSNYLKLIPVPESSPEYRNIFGGEIRKVDVISGNFGADHYPAKSMILNFNYTHTIDAYRNYSDATVNYIHGKIGAIDNPIIFGFGDELDEQYQKIENEKTRGFFKYLKSFGYFKTHGYHDLIRFIELDEFQVHIVGHSCGLSDRTMLNMIFEHANCKSIKIFYHEISEAKNNFTELTEEISRHFRNKGEMRKKIVPFPLSRPMPQVYRIIPGNILAQADAALE